MSSEIICTPPMCHWLKISDYWRPALLWARAGRLTYSEIYTLVASVLGFGRNLWAILAGTNDGIGGFGRRCLVLIAYGYHL